MSQSSILDESFYVRKAEAVARDLLGKVIIHGETAGRIVEVEAYLGVRIWPPMPPRGSRIARASCSVRRAAPMCISATEYTSA